MIVRFALYLYRIYELKFNENTFVPEGKMKRKTGLAWKLRIWRTQLVCIDPKLKVSV